MVTGKIIPKTLKEFQDGLEQFAIAANKDMYDTAIQQAALLCRDSIVFTPPMLASGGGGDTNPAKILGEKAIKHDVKSFYKSENSASAAFRMYRSLGEACKFNDKSMFDRVIKNNSGTLNSLKSNIVTKIAQDPDYDRAFQKAKNLFARYHSAGKSNQLSSMIINDNIQPVHDSLKSKYNGRKIRKKLKNDWLNQFFASNEDIVKEYIDRTDDHVGKLKSGWAKAKKFLPKMRGKQIKNPGGEDPKWITRHIQNTGYSHHNSTENSIKLVVGNMIGDNNNVATDAKTKSIVLGLRVKTMLEDLTKALERNKRKFNKK